MTFLLGIFDCFKKIDIESKGGQIKLGKICGRLIRPNKDPLYGMKVTLATDDLFSRTLGSAVTGSNGEFAFTDLNGFKDYKKLNIVVERVKGEKGILALFTSTVIAKHKICSPFPQNEVSFITEYLEFDKDGFTKDNDHISRPNEDWFVKNILAAGFKPLVIELFETKLNVNSTTEDVQIHFDKVYPRQHLKHDNETLSKMITQWLAPAYTKEKNGLLSFKLNWDAYRNKDSEKGPDLPNVEVFMKPEKDKMTIAEIIVEFPKKDPVSYKPANKNESKDTKDKDDPFIEGLKILACNVLMAAELKHLGKAHLGAGFCAQNFLRYFTSDHPVYGPMEKVVSDTLPINDRGKELIVGPIGIFSQTGLSEGIEKALITIRSQNDYFIRPSPPLFKGDDRAVQENIFYDTALKTATEVIDKRWKQLKKKENWRQVYYFSKGLVENSFPYLEQDLSAIVNSSEIEADFKNVKKLERQKGEDGKLRTFRPITLSMDGPSEGDKERLIVAFTYMIYLVFLHDYLHKLQKLYAVNLSFASLAPRFSKKNAPCLGTDKEAGGLQLLTAWTLVNYDIGHTTMVNYPVKEFKENFTAVIEDFKKVNGDLEQVDDSISI